MVFWTKTESQSEKNFDYITSKKLDFRSEKTKCQLIKPYVVIGHEEYSQKQSLKMRKILTI